jgi:hypothetical protein
MDPIVCAPDAGAVCRRLPTQHQILLCPRGAAHCPTPRAARRLLKKLFFKPREPPFSNPAGIVFKHRGNRFQTSPSLKQTSRQSFSIVATFVSTLIAKTSDTSQPIRILFRQLCIFFIQFFLFLMENDVICRTE